MIRVLIERDGHLREGEAHHLQVRRVESGEAVAHLPNGLGVFLVPRLCERGIAHSLGH